VPVLQPDACTGRIPQATLTHAQAVDRADQFADVLRARVSTTDALRRIPDETIVDLFDLDLFGLATPRRWGGGEFGPETWIEVTARLAAGCGSTGWVYGVLLGHMWLVSQFPADAQAEVFARPDVLVASLVRLGGAAPERVAGGFRWRAARGRFCSGVDHAQWIVVGGNVSSGGDVEQAQARWFLIPTADVTVVDDWFSVGLQGTGSKSIEVAEAFIPEHRSIPQSAVMDGTAPGRAINRAPLYGLSGSTWAFPLPAACLGIAREALRVTRDNLRAKYARTLDAQSALLATFGVAASEIDLANQVLRARAVRLMDSAKRPYSSLESIAHRRDIAFAVQRARRAVNQLLELSGGGGVYASATIERLWRDCNASAAHASFGWDASMAAYGRALLEC
jgi:3-hydroxy-9,10-secoandrosta-1,3,5(10)-triene-9,17-dione monooxygenase